MKKQTKRKLSGMKFKIKKHSPTILIVGGVLGFAGSAVLAYKARPKVEEVVESLEEDRSNNVEVSKVEVVKRVGVALAPAIGLGLVSTGMLMWSHQIQRRRIMALSTSLIASQTAHYKLAEKVKNKLGEKAYNEFITKDERKVFSKDDDGNTTETIEEMKAELDKTLGQWYEESNEYFSDDHQYNLQWIELKSTELDSKLFAKGHLLLNDVRRLLGFEPIPSGQLLGWSSYDTFYIDSIVVNEWDDKKQQDVPNILVTWSKPRYIYQQMD
jgi:hypothetical protein